MSTALIGSGLRSLHTVSQRELATLWVNATYVDRTVLAVYNFAGELDAFLRGGSNLLLNPSEHDDVNEVRLLVMEFNSEFEATAHFWKLHQSGLHAEVWSKGELVQSTDKRV